MRRLFDFRPANEGLIFFFFSEIVNDEPYQQTCKDNDQQIRINFTKADRCFLNVFDISYGTGGIQRKWMNLKIRRGCPDGIFVMLTNQEKFQGWYITES